MSDGRVLGQSCLERTISAKGEKWVEERMKKTRNVKNCRNAS